MLEKTPCANRRLGTVGANRDLAQAFRVSYEAGKKSRRREIFWRRIGVWSGWDRLPGRCQSNSPKNLEHLEGHFAAKRCRPDYLTFNFTFTNPA
jgi:hypothetical protein